MSENIYLQFELNEAKENIQYLLRKIEEQRHLRDEEKSYFSELQEHFEFMSGEMEIMIKNIIELGTEVGFLKTREDRYNATPICMEEKRLAHRSDERLQSLPTKVARREIDINSFWQQVHERA